MAYNGDTFTFITLSSQYHIHSTNSGLVAQAVRCSPPTAGVPSSRLGHSMWVSWWTKQGAGSVFLGVSPSFPYHKFHSTISPHSSHPFRFISSRTYNIGASPHLIPRPDLVLDTS